VGVEGMNRGIENGLATPILSFPLQSGRDLRNQYFGVAPLRKLPCAVFKLLIAFAGIGVSRRPYGLTQIDD